MLFLLTTDFVLHHDYAYVDDNPGKVLERVRDEIHDKLRISIDYFDLVGIQVKGYFWEREDPELISFEEGLSARLKLSLLVSGEAETVAHHCIFQGTHWNDPILLRFSYSVVYPSLNDFRADKKPAGPSALDNFLAVAWFFMNFQRASGFYLGEPRKGAVGYSSNIDLDIQQWDDFCELHYAIRGFKRRTKTDAKEKSDLPAELNWLLVTDAVPGFFGDFVHEDNDEPLTDTEKSELLFDILEEYECRHVRIDNQWVDVKSLNSDRLFENLYEIQESILTYFVRMQGVDLALSFSKPFCLSEEKSFISKKQSGYLMGFTKKLINRLKGKG